MQSTDTAESLGLRLWRAAEEEIEEIWGWRPALLTEASPLRPLVM
jgi:hypothetical protein